MSARAGSRVRTASWALAERLRVDVGGEVESHAEGLSLTELRARYAAPDGGPSAEGFERFCTELFGIGLTRQQQEGARDLATEHRVLIVGGNGLGKDTLAGLWSLYELYVLDALVLVTAPTDRQVKEILMAREIGGRWRRAKDPLPGVLLDRGLRIPGREERGLLAFTATDADHFQGHHAPRLFIAATEAQGIERPIFDAMRRCHPKGTLLTANPTSVLSPVYHFAQSSAWTTQHWSALDHPNVVTGTDVVPGAVTRADVEEIRRTDGEGSRFWQESVLGVWVQEADDALAAPEAVATTIAADHVRALVTQVEPLDPPNQQNGAIDPETGRRLSPYPSPVAVGIDPGGKGTDPTAFAALVRVPLGETWGVVVWRLHEHREGDAVENAERLTALTAQLVGLDRLAVQTVIVDETSLGAVLSPLKRSIPQRVRWGRCVPVFPGYDWRTTTPEVRGFNSSWQALAPAKFLNLRAHAYHELGQLIAEHRLVYAATCEPTLVQRANQEILAHRLVRTGDGKWQLTKKDEVKALVGRSPNLADALAMALLPWLTREKAEVAPHRRVRVLIG